MNKNIQSIAAAGLTIATLLALTVTPVFAQTSGAQVGLNASVTATGGGGVSVSATSGVKLNIFTRAQQRADEEITRRINALNTLNTRIGDMQRITGTEKTSLQASVQGQITLMNTLETQIASDTAAESTSSLKADIQSITVSYRIFLLIIPQGAIEAASDRILDVAGLLTTASGQLQARISSAEASGTDVTAAEASLADMNAKIADANTQATAANSEVESLVPDNGNQTQLQANTAALKDARTKIQTGQQDLVAARQDALAILKDLNITLTASATASTTAQ